MAVCSSCLPSLGAVLEGGVWVCHRAGAKAHCQCWPWEPSKVWQMSGRDFNIQEHKHGHGSNISAARERGFVNLTKPNLWGFDCNTPCTFSEGGHCQYCCSLGKSPFDRSVVYCFIHKVIPVLKGIPQKNLVFKWKNIFKEKKRNLSSNYFCVVTSHIPGKCKTSCCYFYIIYWYQNYFCIIQYSIIM